MNKRQREPVQEVAAPKRTEVRVLIGKSNLYT